MGNDITMTKDKTVDSSMDFGGFEDWYEDFIDQYGGTEIDWALEDWFVKSNNNKSELREEINLSSIMSKVTIEGQQNPIDLNLLRDFKYSIIDKYFPAYFEEYGLSIRDLTLPILPNGIRTTKHIIEYVRRSKALVGEITLNQWLDALGKLYAGARTEKETVYGLLTTEPHSFLLLGHYGPDNNSCFAQGKCNDFHKMKLACQPNSFVFLIKDNDSPLEKDNLSDILARMWGFYNPEDKVINFCNLYLRLKPTYYPTNAFIVAKHMAAKVLGVDPEEVSHKDRIISVTDGIYHNAKATQPSWSFYYDTGREIKTQYFNQN